MAQTDIQLLQLPISRSVLLTELCNGTNDTHALLCGGGNYTRSLTRECLRHVVGENE